MEYFYNKQNAHLLNYTTNQKIYQTQDQTLQKIVKHSTRKKKKESECVILYNQSCTVGTELVYMYDWIHERIDQSIHIGSRGLI
jgi:hypothetical protein